MNLSVNLAGVKLEHPIMNAAGTCKRLEGEEGVEGLLRTMTAAVVVGSITIEPRDGNSGNVYFYEDPRSLNSLGMPNPGLKYWEKNLPEAVRRCHDAGKALIMSVAGFKSHEFGVLTSAMYEYGADLVELNLGCPNVLDDGHQHDIFSFDFDAIHNVLTSVDVHLRHQGKVIVKTSPYSNPNDLKRAAKVFNRWSPFVRGITTTNTFPNGFAFGNDLKSAIGPNDGLAGMGGPAMKSIGLGQVVQFRRELDPAIQVLGAGGVGNGKDVRDYRAVKADAVQLATAFLQRGGKVFNSILDEYLALSES